MSGLLRKICVFIVFGCFAASVAHSATVYTTNLIPNGGTANPDYLTKICKMYGVGGARPDSNGVCSTNDSDYVNPFNLSSSPINEFPQKYANHVDATDGYETFLGYMPSEVHPRIDNTGNYVDLTNSSGNGAMYAWWGGVTDVTPFTVNYYDGDTLVGTQSCTFGDSTGCDVLSPVGLLTAPTGKYFDGWRCASSTGYNCRANRYLPPDYANLSTPITPYGTSPISNWPDISATRYRDDLRNANGDVVTNMSYEYTGTHVINLYAAWAPYNVTFKCAPRTSSPYVGASTRTQSTYLDANGIIHDIVYGSVIPLNKNFGGASTNPLCKSVYYKYDNDNGNDQWCSQYLDSAAGINSNASTVGGLGEVGGVGGTNYPYTYLGSKHVELYGSCSRYTLTYSCGSFNGETVPGVPPHQRKSLTNNGLIATNFAYGSKDMLIERRKYPFPEKPYRTDSNDGYMACNTQTLTPTAGANAGVPQIYGVPVNSTASTLGYGCCEKPQYAEFKGYQVRRSNANGEILNNGELIQPGQYGASNCSVSFNNNTNPDTWQPGCDLWPWKGTAYLEAIWEHTPIQITFNHNGANNAANLVNNVWLKYGEGFYENHTGNGYSGEIVTLSTIPTHSDGLVFGGYQYCDTNDVCTMIVNSNGEFISGTDNLKFTDVDVTATVVWTAATVECLAGTYLDANTQECESCIAGNYCPGGSYELGQSEDLGIYICGTDSWSDDGASACTNCLTANGYHNSGLSFIDHAHESSCITTCIGGQCVPVARAACANVGAGGWSSGGNVPQGNTLACNVCPSGEMTIGYGVGANESGDCGRVLHVGDSQLYLRSDRKTEHTLNFKIGDKIYYANMSTDNIGMSHGATKALKLRFNNTTYSAYDDSALE